MKHSKPYQIAIFGVLAASYIALRLWRLTDSCLWFDEIFSIHAAEHSWNSILSFVSLDLIHPPLFYLLLKVWIGVGGESLLWLRSFPAMFAVTAIFPFLYVCRELKLPYWTRILAFFFFAVNGSLIKYAQEVRMYSLLMCLALFSMWLFTRYFIKGKSFVPLLIVNLLLVYTHYFGWFVIIAQVVAILIFQRIKWRRIVAMFAILAAAYIPWMMAIWQAARTGSGLDQNIGWMSRPDLLAIAQLQLNLIEPFYFAASSVDPSSIYRICIPILLIAAAAFVLYLINWKGQTEDAKRSVYLSGIFAGLPIMVAFAASWLLPYSIWGTRHLVIVFAPVGILIATAITNLSNTKLKTGAVTLILLFSGYAFALQALSDKPEYSWCAWEPLASEAKSDNNANIYTFEDLVAYHIWFAQRDQNTQVQIFKVTDITGITEDAAYFLPRGFDGVKTTDFATINERKLWIAYRFSSIDEGEPPLRNFIVGGYHVVEQKVIPANGESAIFLLLEK